MTWISRWKNISSKIANLQEVSRSYFDSINSFGVDHYGIGGSSIIPAAREIYAEILELKKISIVLPHEVIVLINKLEKTFSGHHKFTGIPGVGGAMVLLGIFNSEMNHYLKDHETVMKDKVKLSLVHLQRTLLVDSELRHKWTQAFNEGEAAIEKLGANHLLSHGLWAFKPLEESKRADLVLSAPIKLDEVQEVGATLVLTEWKKVNFENLAEKSKEALTQARKYGASPVAATELRKEKYLIMVSENRTEMPIPVNDGDIRYVYINLSLSAQYVELKNSKNLSPAMTWAET